MTTGEDLMALLYLLAEQTGENVSAPRVKFYVERLAPLGAGRVVPVLQRMLDGARRFPTVNEIKAELGEAPESVEDRARQIAERIYTAIAKGWGSSRNADVIAHRDEFVGEAGVQVVRLLGGWDRLANSVMVEDATTHKAQWREFAAAILRRGPGGLDKGPGWDVVGPGEDLFKLPSVIDVAKLEEGP